MTIEQIDRMVREANPVPDLRALEPVDLSDLRFTQQRSEDVQTQDKIDLDREPDRGNRGLWIGVAAAVLVLIGALIYFQGREEAPVVTQVPDSEAAAIATAFVEALTPFDIERMTSLLTPSALAEGWDSADGLRREIAFSQAQGQKVLLDSCQETGSSPSGATVRCDYAYHAIRSDEIGLGPFGGNYFDLTIADGKIVSFTGRHAL